MQLNPYLNFNGQCAAAFRFYEKAFGGKIVMMQTQGETPARDHAPAEWHDKIVHVRMTVGDQVLMGSDAPGPHYATPQGFAVSITVPKAADAERIFNALAEDGKVTMPFQKTFWSRGFGMATDRFGTPWMVNCEQQPESVGA